MTFDQFLQVLGVLGPIAGAAAAARWGHRQVMQKLERDYVTLESHRASMTTIHAEKNALRDRVSQLEGEKTAQIKLDEKQDAEIAFLKAAFLAREQK